MSMHHKRMIRDFFATLSFVLLLDLLRSILSDDDIFYTLELVRDIWDIAILFLIIGYIRHKSINAIKLIGLCFVIYAMITVGYEMLDISWQISESLAYTLIIATVAYLSYWCTQVMRKKLEDKPKND